MASENSGHDASWSSSRTDWFIGDFVLGYDRQKHSFRLWNMANGGADVLAIAGPQSDSTQRDVLAQGTECNVTGRFNIRWWLLQNACGWQRTGSRLFSWARCTSSLSLMCIFHELFQHSTRVLSICVADTRMWFILCFQLWHGSLVTVLGTAYGCGGPTKKIMSVVRNALSWSHCEVHGQVCPVIASLLLSLSLIRCLWYRQV